MSNTLRQIKYIVKEIPGFSQSRDDLETNKATIDSYIVTNCGGQRSKNDIRSEIPRLDGAISCLGKFFNLKVNRNNSFAVAYWLTPGSFFSPHTLDSRNANQVILYFLRPSSVDGFLKFNSDTLIKFDAIEQLAVLFNGTDNWETEISSDNPDTLLLEVLINKC